MAGGGGAEARRDGARKGRTDVIDTAAELLGQETCVRDKGVKHLVA